MGTIITVTMVLSAAFLGGLYLVAGASKFLELRIYRESVMAYGILPQRWVGPFATLIPVLEISVGTMLVFGFATALASLLAGLLLGLFSLATAIVVRRHQSITCACFGSRSDLMSGWTLYRNAGLFMLVVLVFGVDASQPPGSMPLGLRSLPRATPPDLIVGLLISGLAIAGWWLLGQMGRRWLALDRSLRRGSTGPELKRR